MRVAWFDVSAGVAGDMLLGALVDAGADLPSVQDLVDRVLPDTVRLEAHSVERAGLRALKVDVRLLVEDQPHRSWREIRERVAAAGLPTPVASNATEVFRRLAEVESRSHGVAVDDVEFHEVGAWDSVADVVGVCAAAHLLEISPVVAAPMALGSGAVRTAHGELPVPSPAVLALVEGWSVHGGGAGELATPTGVALVTTLATSQGVLPRMEVVGTGVGAGTRDPSDRANVVRVVLGQPAETEPAAETLTLLETNIDDLDPRVWPSVLATLMDAGAADAWLTPVLMKKGRPAHTLSVLCPAPTAAELRDRMFVLTSTLGVRQSQVERYALARGWVDVQVGGGRVAVKVSHRDSEIVHATPEFDDVAALAAELERPVRELLASAVAAAEAAGLTPGAGVPESLRPTHTADSRG